MEMLGTHGEALSACSLVAHDFIGCLGRHIAIDTAPPPRVRRPHRRRLSFPARPFAGPRHPDEKGSSREGLG